MVIAFFFFCFEQHFDCRNHIRVIQPMSDGNRLYICGTNAHSPKDWVIYVSISHSLSAFLFFFVSFFFFPYTHLVKTIIYSLLFLFSELKSSIRVMMPTKNTYTRLECCRRLRVPRVSSSTRETTHFFFHSFR